MTLDVRTILILYLLINILLIIIIAYYYKNHKTYPGLGYWFISQIALSAGYLLYLLRPVTPLFISYILANIFLIMTVFSRLIAVLAFIEKKNIRYRLIFFLMLICIAFLLMISYIGPLPVDSPERVFLRGVLLTFISSVCFGMIVYQLMKKDNPFHFKINRMLVAIFIFFIIISVHRILTYAFTDFPMVILNPALYNAVFYLASIAVEIGVTITFLLMQSQRLAHELKQTGEKLDSANAAKNKLFSLIGHDLKNPISAIHKITQMFQSEYRNLNDEQIADYFNMLISSSKETYLLVENLLTWAQSQSGTIEISKKPMSVYDLMQQAVAQTKNQLLQKEIDLDNQVRPGLIIVADYHMTLTVFRNLLSNAVKYSYKKGKVEISAEAGEDFIDIAFKDFGVGMGAEKVDKLFRIAENITSPGTEKERGTGLGLLICKDFIDRNLGEIKVVSEKNRGSTFTVSLPVYQDK